MPDDRDPAQRTPDGPARGVGRARTVALYLLSASFVLAGANHFRDADFYVQIMPPYVPWHLPLVYLSGVAEIALGLLCLPRRTRALAGLGLVALLVAVFPANVHMALSGGLVDGAPAAPAWALWARLPLQGALIAWAWWATRPPRGGRFAPTRTR